MPWRRKWQSTPVLLPGKSRGQRSLVGYSPWSLKESDTTKQLISFHHVLGLDESILWKWLYYPKQSIDLMQSLSNTSRYFSTELEQIISQFVWKHKKLWIAKEILRKKSGSGGINLSDFRIYYKVQSSRQHGTSTKIEYRPIEQQQQQQQQNLEISSHVNGHLIFD